MTVGITSYFYTGPVNGQAWGEAQQGVGDLHWAGHDTAGKVSVLSGTTIQFATGPIGGGGVMDNITVAQQFEIPTPVSDGVKYWTAGALRTWQTTNETVMTAVEGSSTRLLAAGLDDQPGTIFFTPHALVRVEKSGATITAAVTDDLRLVGSQGRFTAGSDLARTIDLPRGTVVRVAGTDWLRSADGSWTRILTPIETGTGFFLSNSAANFASMAHHEKLIVRDGRWRHVTVEQNAWDSVVLGSGSSGDTADLTLWSLANSRDFPVSNAEVAVRYNYSESGALAYGWGRLYVGGDFNIVNLTPNLDLRGRGLEASGYDVRVSFSYMARSL